MYRKIMQCLIYGASLHNQKRLTKTAAYIGFRDQADLCMWEACLAKDKAFYVQTVNCTVEKSQWQEKGGQGPSIPPRAPIPP